MIIFFMANNIAWIIFLNFFPSNDRSELSSNAWTRMGQAKRQENAINSMTSFIFIRICTFHVCWWKNFALLFWGCYLFFLNLSQRLKCDKIFALLLPTGLLESLKMVAFLLNRQLILLWGFQLLTIFDDPNIPHSYPKNRNQSHMPECCLSKLKQTGNHGNQWTSYKGKCWFDP